MWVSRLGLQSFRNHELTNVSFGPGLNVICGPNGAGKTSLLEAVHLVATNHSFRTTDDAALRADGADVGVIRATFERDGRNQEIRIGLGNVPHRFVLNGTPYKAARDVVGLLRAVVFAPDDLELVKGSPGVRRDFCDTAMLTVSPRLETVTGEWARALKQRNALLKSLGGRMRGEAPATLATWTDLLAEKGAALVAARLSFIDRLRDPFRRNVAELLGRPGEVTYAADWLDADVDVTTPTEVLADRLRAAAEAQLGREVERGLTLVGPHRDDLLLRLDGRDARSRASQGEQRTCALALRLGHLDVLSSVLTDDPVLLLDDVFSELDPQRRAALVDRLPGAQALVTTTADGGRIEDLPADVAELVVRARSAPNGAARVIHVVDGKIAGIEDGT